MSRSPVAMFEPVLRGLQHLAATDVDEPTEAAVCIRISTSMLWWSLPATSFTPAVWDELIMVQKVFAKACEACGALAKRPQSAAAQTAVCVLTSILEGLRTALHTDDTERGRLLSALCEQAVQAKLLQHITPLLVAATVGLQRLTPPAAPAASAGSTNSSSNGGSNDSSGSSGGVKEQQDAYAAAAATAYAFAGGVMGLWALLAGTHTEWDAAVFKEALPSTPALLSLALTVLQSLSKLQGVRPPAALTTAVSYAGGSMLGVFMRVGNLARPIVESVDPSPAASKVDPAMQKLMLCKPFLPCLALCIAVRGCQIEHSPAVVTTAAASSSDGSSSAGGGSSSSADGGSSSSARGANNTTTTSSQDSRAPAGAWSYQDGLSAHSSGSYPVATAFKPQLLALLNISEQTAAVAVSAASSAFAGAVTFSASSMWPHMWALRLWGQVRRNTLVPPQQRVKVPAAQQEQELQLLGFLPRLLLRSVVNMPSNHPDFPVSCSHALLACNTTPRCWQWLTDNASIFAAPSLQHQQRFAAMLEGMLPVLFQVYLKLSEPQTAAMCSMAAGGSRLQHGASACFDALHQVVQFLSHCFPDYLTMAKPALGGSSSGSSGSSAASDPTLAALQRNGANMLAVFEGCLRHMAALTASSSAAAQPDASSAEDHRLRDAVSHVGFMGFAPVDGSSQLRVLVSAAGYNSMEHRQLYSLFSTMVTMVDRDGAEWAGSRGTVRLAILQTLTQAHLPTTLKAVAAGSSCSSSSASASTQSATAAAAAAVALPVLPSLVLFGRVLLSLSQHVQQQSPGVLSWKRANPKKRKGKLADRYPEAALCFESHPGSPTDTHASELPVFTLSALEWLRCQPIAAQLTSAGYDVGGLIQQLEQLLAARDAAASKCTEATLAELVRQLHVAGSGLAALAVPVFCNSPACDHLAGPSAISLVSGLSCLCGGCETARYCSKACQRVHWKAAHKPVCKALAAAAAAGGADAGGGEVSCAHSVRAG